MNPIETVLKEIYISIPYEVLELAFNPRRRGLTLDDCIQEDVIVPKVLYDCNLVGGKYAEIPLQSHWAVPTEIPSPYISMNQGRDIVYKIPPEAREGRPIADCISIKYPYSIYSGGSLPGMNTGYMNPNTVGGYACTALNSMTYEGVMPTPTPIRLSGHSIKLMPPAATFDTTIPWVLICRLCYDEEFTNLVNKAHRPLAALCVCAVKAHIYTNLIVKIDRQYLSGGQELASIKNIVDSYSSELEKYEELLRNFNGTAVSLDPEGLYRTLRAFL